MAIKGIYDSINHEAHDSRKVLEIFNKEFIEKYIFTNSYVTAIIVDVVLMDKKLIYSSAGHPPAVLIQNNEISLLEKTGKMIGVMENGTYDSLEFRFQLRDRLLLFTDGIFEEFNFRKEEFGEGRLHSVFIDTCTMPLEQSIQEVLRQLDRFLDGKEKQDDVTVLGVEYK